MQCRLMMKTPWVEQYALQSLSWYIFVDRHFSAFPLSQSGARHGLTLLRVHIVTDNKATSVETGSALFRADVFFLTQSSRGQVGCSWLRHLCHICDQNPQLLDAVCWAVERKQRSRSCYFHLRVHMVDLADSQAPAPMCLPQRLLGSVFIADSDSRWLVQSDIFWLFSSISACDFWKQAFLMHNSSTRPVSCWLNEASYC